MTPWPTTERTLDRQMVEGEVVTALTVLAQVGAEKQLGMHTDRATAKTHTHTHTHTHTQPHTG